MAEAPGSMVGHYRILSPIGSGGFATVYRARDERLGAEVALKILAENHALDPEIRARFLREARLLRQVTSEHVITLFDVGETERLQPYLVLRLATGGDLRRRVTRAHQDGRRATDDDLRRVIDALADALSTIHDAGVVHRDVSPGNLLLVGRADADDAPCDDIIGGDVRLVLSDLGYAKDLTQHSGLTVGGGTSGFNAPEQRAGLGRIDRRADVYAAGAVVSWLLTGEVHGERADAHLAPHVGNGLGAALLRSLSADPDDRQPDMQSWADALRSGLEADRAGDAVADATTDDRTPEPPPHASRRRLVALLLGALVVVATATAIVAWSRSNDSAAVSTTLDDGRVRIARTDEGVDVAIFGPATLAVGEPATFEADITGGRDYFWLAPDGSIIRTQPSIVVTAASTGADVVLSLTVVNAEGTPVTVTRRVRVDG